MGGQKPSTGESFPEYWRMRFGILVLRPWSWMKIGVDMGVRTVFQGLSPAPEVSFIRNRGNFHLQAVNFAPEDHVCKDTGRCRH